MLNLVSSLFFVWPTYCMPQLESYHVDAVSGLIVHHSFTAVGQLGNFSRCFHKGQYLQEVSLLQGLTSTSF